MAKSKKAANPFYFLLVIAGVAFLISACAYGVMAFRDVSLSTAAEPLPQEGLLGFMNRHGVLVLSIEVILLGVFTVGAIGTDEFWQRRHARRSETPGD